MLVIWCQNTQIGYVEFEVILIFKNVRNTEKCIPIYLLRFSPINPMCQFSWLTEKYLGLYLIFGNSNFDLENINNSLSNSLIILIKSKMINKRW